MGNGDGGSGGGGDQYSLMQEAHQKATKDSFCLLSAKPLDQCEPAELTVDLPAGEGVLPIYNNLGATEHLLAQAAFDHGSGGTSAKFYIQSSLDKEVSWFDVICFAFTTSSARKLASATLGDEEVNPENAEDGTLPDNTTFHGVLGDVFRVKYKIVGVYANTTIRVTGLAKSF